MLPEPTPHSDSVRWPLQVLLGATLLAAFATTVADADLWGHLRFGQDILAAGGVVRTDPYSYLSMPGSWINHEWLAEVSFALAYGALGVWGLTLLKVLVGMATMAALYLDVRQGSARAGGATLVTVLVALTVMPTLRQVRPQIYTVALMTALLLVLRHYELGRRRLLLLTVPIMALWINLHGGVLAGAGVLAAWYGARVLRRAWRMHRLRHWLGIVSPYELAVMVAALAATLLNPYGAGLPLFLLRTATGSRLEIQDWQPAALNSYHGVGYILLILMLAGVYLKARRRPSFGQSAVLLVVAMVSLGAARHVALLGLCVGVFAGPALQSLLPVPRVAPAPSEASESVRPPGRKHLAIHGVMLLAASLTFGFGVRLMGVIPMPPEFFPVQAVSLLKQTVQTANVVTPYNWGEYVIWHLGPALQVSMDGRRETVYDDATFQTSLALHDGATGWAEAVDLPASDLVLAEANSPSDSLMRLKPGWTLVYADEIATIFAREGSDLASVLQAGAPKVAPLPDKLVFP